MKIQKFNGFPIKGPEKGIINWVTWAFFGNELDGPLGDNRWNPERKDDIMTRVKWWIRNPMHNLTWHVIGFAHKPSTRYDINETDQKGWNHAWSILDETGKKYNFYLYIGKTWTFYAGWRGRGNFGFKFNKTKK